MVKNPINYGSLNSYDKDFTFITVEPHIKDLGKLYDKINKAKSKNVDVNIVFNLDSLYPVDLYNYVDLIKQIISDNPNFRIDAFYFDVSKIENESKENYDELLKTLDVIGANGVYVGLYGDSNHLNKLVDINSGFSNYDSCVIGNEKTNMPSITTYNYSSLSFTRYVDLHKVIMDNDLNNSNNLLPIVTETYDGIDINDFISKLETKYGIPINYISEYNNVIFDNELEKGTLIKIPNSINILKINGKQYYESSNYEVGIDISSYQGEIKEDVLKEWSKKLDYVYVRGSEGLQEDEQFYNNVSNLENHNIPFNVYFLNGVFQEDIENVNEDLKLQKFAELFMERVNHWLKMIDGVNCSEVALDWEGKSTKLDSKFVPVAFNLFNRAVKEAGYIPVIYFGGEAKEQIKDSKVDLNDYVIWYAGGNGYDKPGTLNEVIENNKDYLNNNKFKYEMFQISEATTDCGFQAIDLNIRYVNPQNEINGKSNFEYKRKPVTNMNLVRLIKLFNLVGIMAWSSLYFRMKKNNVESKYFDNQDKTI